MVPTVMQQRRARGDALAREGSAARARGTGGGGLERGQWLLAQQPAGPGWRMRADEAPTALARWRQRRCRVRSGSSWARSGFFLGLIWVPRACTVQGCQPEERPDLFANGWVAQVVVR
jgi:hypothetical protein